MEEKTYTIFDLEALCFHVITLPVTALTTENIFYKLNSESIIPYTHTSRYYENMYDLQTRYSMIDELANINENDIIFIVGRNDPYVRIYHPWEMIITDPINKLPYQRPLYYDHDDYFMTLTRAQQIITIPTYNIHTRTDTFLNWIQYPFIQINNVNNIVYIMHHTEQNKETRLVKSVGGYRRYYNLKIYICEMDIHVFMELRIFDMFLIQLGKKLNRPINYNNNSLFLHIHEELTFKLIYNNLVRILNLKEYITGMWKSAKVLIVRETDDNLPSFYDTEIIQTYVYNNITTILPFNDFPINLSI